MRSFWDCSICKEEYKKRTLHCRIVADYAFALDEQEKKHIDNHLNQEERELLINKNIEDIKYMTFGYGDNKE